MVNFFNGNVSFWMKFSGTTKSGRMVDNHELLCISKAKHRMHLEPLNSGYTHRMMLKMI